MTLFAGIVARNSSKTLTPSMRQSLAGEISRFQREEVTEISGAGFHFAKVDIGAFGSSGLCRDGESRIALLAGEPLLSDDGPGRPRAKDLQSIQQAVESGDLDVLRSATGTFCAAIYNADSGALTLIADKFGVRPIYYWIGEEFAVFSTALRVIEKLAELPKRMDIDGVLEIAAFGFPLGDRTAYRDIRTIREAELVTIGRQSIDKACYWRWDQLPAFSGSPGDAASAAHRQFTRAVERRLGADGSVAAFLSGGLDSRAIVATLRQLNTTVHTANCSRPGTQDELFGPRIAAALKCIHTQVDPCHERPGDPYRKRGVTNWLSAEAASRDAPDRPRIVWGGDGGSVGVGHVYLTQEMVDQMRQNQPEQASRTFLHHNRIGLPAGALSPKAAPGLSSIPRKGMLDELSRLHCLDPGRRIHLFLMLNDQRRHMAEHFENIDIDRIEFQLPFFDAQFMELILSLPIDICLRHAFYLEWLKQFDPVVVSEPWQAYPGHLPCPIPIPPGITYQWAKETSPETRKSQRQLAASYVKNSLANTHFPRSILSGPRLLVASLLTYFAIQDYSYALRFASTVLKYSTECAPEIAEA